MRSAVFAAFAAFVLHGATQAPDWSPAQSVTVELSNFRFTPSVIALRRGVRYRLHLANNAAGGHDFVARDFFANSDIAPTDRAKVVGGKVDLGSGESVDIMLTPTRTGTYDLHCSHFMHAVFGMKGKIEVR
jgi:uncharacterized cupredoxin-like copper-binding protein